jgi:hypothetical protein
LGLHFENSMQKDIAPLLPFSEPISRCLPSHLVFYPKQQVLLSHLLPFNCDDFDIFLSAPARIGHLETFPRPHTSGLRKQREHRRLHDKLPIQRDVDDELRDSLQIRRMRVKHSGHYERLGKDVCYLLVRGCLSLR